MDPGIGSWMKFSRAAECSIGRAECSESFWQWKAYDMSWVRLRMDEDKDEDEDEDEKSSKS